MITQQEEKHIIESLKKGVPAQIIATEIRGTLKRLDNELIVREIAEKQRIRIKDQDDWDLSRRK